MQFYIVPYVVKRALEKKREPCQWNRKQAAEIMDAQQSHGGSLAAFAKEADVPRTTLQHWNNRRKSLDLPPATVNFFESPDGQDFLHRLSIALILELHEHGSASLRDLSAFLRRVQLDRFIPASKTSLEKAAKEVELTTIDFAEKEKGQLAKMMPEKNISIAEDETFPSGICLVAIELRSNYVLLERMVPDRKTATWDKQMNQTLQGLPVNVVQSVGDEAKSLVKHVECGLGAHHSPDTFHIQQELTKAGSAQLKLKMKRKTEALLKIKKKTERLRQKQSAHEALETKPRGRPVDYKARIENALNAERAQVAAITVAQQKNDRFHSARRSISAFYHPYNLESGLAQSPADVAKNLENAFDKIQGIVKGSGASFEKRVGKARKLVASMKATVLFYFITVAAILDEKNYDDRTLMLLEDFLIPACYLESVATKTSNKEKACDITYLKNDLMAEFECRAGPFALYTDQQLEDMLSTAKECAAVFQRSSSPVEGRNGQLALKHHNLHKLSDRKLACLTVLHNFDTRRKDGSTPAERFFENKHGDLFKYLLENTAMPGRPRIASRLRTAA